MDWRELNSVAVTVVMASQIAKMGEIGIIAGVMAGRHQVSSTRPLQLHGYLKKMECLWALVQVS